MMSTTCNNLAEVHSKHPCVDFNQLTNSKDIICSGMLMGILHCEQIVFLAALISAMGIVVVKLRGRKKREASKKDVL